MDFEWRRVRNSPGWMVVIAFILRFGFILIAHTYKFKTVDDNFSFGFEMGRIGRALASGQGFSSPFTTPSGATAWEPPVYPFFIAGVFKLLGIYTRASALLILSVNSLFSALTCIPIYLIARRCFSLMVAQWTAWLWAVLPPAMFWCTRWIWETSLAAFLLAMIFWITLVMEERQGVGAWLQFGLLWGFAALTNTSMLAFLPASGLWIWYRRYRLGKKSFGGLALSAVVFAVCISPWLVRNYETFGKFIFIRSNFGAELRLGNGPGADGTWMKEFHPTQSVYQMNLYRRMGEVAYVAERKRQAVAFIRENRGRFAILCMKRFVFYWTGLAQLVDNPLNTPLKNGVFVASSALGFWGLGRAIRKRVPGAWLFFWLMLCYPLIYYVAFSLPRYRHPIEPELGILIVYVVSETESKSRSGSKTQLNRHESAQRSQNCAFPVPPA